MLIESALEILVAAFLNISLPVVNTYGEYISLISSYTFIILLMGFAVGILLYLMRKFG